MPSAPETTTRRPTLAALVRAHADLLPAIGAGGAIGALARWGLASAVPPAGTGFPLATFLTNLSGALLLGLLMAFVLGPWSHTRYVRPFFGVGVLGGYTTFSTYELDSRGLFAGGASLTALGYLIATVVLGLVAVWAGAVAGRLVITRLERRHGHEIAFEPAPIDPDLDPDGPAPQED
ncbi:CrcB family protein [Nocardioides sp. DS6]|uniref:Fluoride-specific ion channel FluC n=1 Tax=Nocardioides eburneus TaxID=3231482 RepID=A0ABV3SY09_9ACTN